MVCTYGFVGFNRDVCSVQHKKLTLKERKFLTIMCKYENSSILFIRFILCIYLSCFDNDEYVSVYAHDFRNNMSMCHFALR